MVINFDAQDKFNKDKRFTQIKFGENAPLLEVELNEMQKIHMEAQAEIVRKMIPSGFIVPGELQFNNVPLNNIRVAPQEVNINGYILNIPQTDIELTEPPTMGYRDDFVFLEVWFEEVSGAKDSTLIDARLKSETSRRVKLNYRYRVVEDVDFTYTPDGFTYPLKDLPKGVVQAMGALESPLNHPLGNLSTDPIHRFGAFYSAERRNNTSIASKKIALKDNGLYIAGLHNIKESMDSLGTVDGLSYAIPMFRVKRLNNSGFSAVNPNGALKIAYFSVNYGEVVDGNTAVLPKGLESVVRVPDSGAYESIKVGDTLLHSNKVLQLKVVGKSSGNKLTVLASAQTQANSNSNVQFSNIGTFKVRPDREFSNIITRDYVVDLRKSVSLKTIDYQRVLDKNFKLWMQGMLNERAGRELITAYLGIPKQPVDSNTVFSLPFDNSLKTEVGSLVQNLSINGYKPMPTGSGAVFTFTGVQSAPTVNPIDIPSGQGTIEFILDVHSLNFPTYNSSAVLTLIDASNLSALEVHISEEYAITATPKGYTSGSPHYFWNSNRELVNKRVRYAHVRICWTNGSGIDIYVNGVKQTSYSGAVNIQRITGLVIGMGHTSGSGINYGVLLNGVISNLQISKVNRAGNFASITQDVIEGKASISSPLQGQRHVLSDAPVKSKVVGVARPKGKTSTDGISVTTAKDNLWNDYATIRVSSKDGIISGTPKLTYRVGNEVRTVATRGSMSGTTYVDIEIGALADSPGLDDDDIYVEYEIETPKGMGGLPEVFTEVLEAEYNGERYVLGSPEMKSPPHLELNGTPIHVLHEVSGRGVLTELTSENGSKIVKLGDGETYQNISITSQGSPYTHSYGIISEINLFLDVGIQYNDPSVTVKTFKQWLLDNVESVSYNAYAKASQNDVQGVRIDAIAGGVDGFKSAPKFSSNVNTEDAIKSLTLTMTAQQIVDNGLLTSQGMLHFYIRTIDNSGISTSMEIDFAEFRVKFKVPTGYITLVAEDSLKREVGKYRNVIMVNPVNKEVRTLFPPVDNNKLKIVGKFLPKVGVSLHSIGLIGGEVLHVGEGYLTSITTTDPTNSRSYTEASTRIRTYFNVLDEFLNAGNTKLQSIVNNNTPNGEVILTDTGSSWVGNLIPLGYSMGSFEWRGNSTYEGNPITEVGTNGKVLVSNDMAIYLNFLKPVKLNPNFKGALLVPILVKNVKGEIYVVVVSKPVINSVSIGINFDGTHTTASIAFPVESNLLERVI